MECARAMHRFSRTAERAGCSRTDVISAISSRTGVVRLISIGLGAHGMRISSAYRSAETGQTQELRTSFIPL